MFVCQQDVLYFELGLVVVRPSRPGQDIVRPKLLITHIVLDTHLTESFHCQVPDFPQGLGSHKLSQAG